METGLVYAAAELAVVVQLRSIATAQETFVPMTEALQEEIVGHRTNLLW